MRVNEITITAKISKQTFLFGSRQTPTEKQSILSRTRGIMDSLRNGTSGKDKSLRLDYFLFVWKKYPQEKIARTKTRNKEHSEHSGTYTRKIKTNRVRVWFPVSRFHFHFTFCQVFREVPGCPGVPCFSTCHAKLPVSFSTTYLCSIMSLWKCLYTFITDSVPNLKKGESYNKLQVYLLYRHTILHNAFQFKHEKECLTAIETTTIKCL